MQAQAWVYSNRVLGNAVKNPRGEELGKLEEIVINLDEGRPVYVVLSLASGLLKADKLLAVPWSLVTVSSDVGTLILNIDGQILDNVPVFEKDRWPDMSDPRWAESVHTYFRTDEAGTRKDVAQ